MKTIRDRCRFLASKVWDCDEDYISYTQEKFHLNSFVAIYENVTDQTHSERAESWDFLEQKLLDQLEAKVKELQEARKEWAESLK